MRRQEIPQQQELTAKLNTIWSTIHKEKNLKTLSLESNVEGSDEHEEDAAGPEDGADHVHDLVDDVGEGDVVVVLDDVAVVAQQVRYVGDGGGHPSPALVVEFLQTNIIETPSLNII